MAISADIEAVTTEDATPTEAPYRISAVPGKDSVTFRVKVTATGAIRAIRSRFKPLNRNIGQRVYSRGMVCGSGDRCGTPDARSLNVASPFTTPTIEIDEADIASEPDGEYEVEAWAMEPGAWSS